LQKHEAFCKRERVCTLAIYFRMLPDYPLLVAANRDEHYDRPSAPPSLLESTPKIIAGRDLRAGGTWLGVNEHGVLAALLNRRVNSHNTAFPDARSRGLLCMDLLACRSAAEAEAFIRGHRGSYNPFTALVADRSTAHVSYNVGQRIMTQRLEPGLHVFSSAAEFNLHSAKADRAYALFGQLGERLRGNDDTNQDAVTALHAALGDHSLPPGSSDSGDAICVHRDSSGTVSSSIVLCSSAMPRFKFFHCAGAPCQNSFGAPLELEIR
jgi:uncharacterized protein with NRDE domain